MMDIRLLGPVEVWRDDTRLPTGPRKQRFCLALLALELNSVVTIDRLVDLSWPASPPRTARHAIAVSVSRLRAVLRLGEGGRHVELATHGAGYALRADPECVDVHRFRYLVRRARACAAQTERLRLLREALGQWQGAPLVDTGPPEVVDRLTSGLRQERMAAEEERIDAELRIGNHSGVIGPLVDLVARHPHRQRLVGQLMLAQHRAGLSADALATYRTARTTMATDVGLDPGARLRELQHAILRGDDSVELPTTGW